MLNIACEKCDGRCCTSKIRKLFVVLVPKEEKKFKKFSTKIKVFGRNLKVLKKNKDGSCIFFDSEKKLCRIYKKRPFECRVYPLLIYFDKKVKFKLDKKVCPRIRRYALKNFKRLKKEWLKQNAPLSWIKAYSKFD